VAVEATLVPTDEPTEATPATVTPTPQPGSAVLLPPSPTYTPDQLAAACVEVEPYQLQKAITNANSEVPPKTILWTFGVNFQAVSAASGAPLACLKLYNRVEGSAPSPATYVPINAGFVLDVCGFVGDPVGIDINNGLATFDGQGYIGCSLNLGAWVTNVITGTPGLAPEVADALERFDEEDPQGGGTEGELLETHSYAFFTLFAKATVDQALTSAAAAGNYTIAVYHPGPANAETAPLVLDVTDPPRIAFGDCETSEFVGTPGRWWFDAQATQRAYVLQWDSATPTPCGTDQAGSEFFFPLSGGVLYIGGDPNLGSPFIGTIYGVLIDPTDSKPPPGDT
jgi:hypothetical protein